MAAEHHFLWAPHPHHCCDPALVSSGCFLSALSSSFLALPFFFFCVPSYISGVHPSFSSSSVFPALSLRGSPFFFCVPSYISWVHHSSSSAFPATSLGFTSLLLLLRSQLYLWGSPFFFFCCCCVPSYISGVHHSYSPSAFPAISLGFTSLLLRSQLCLWGSPFYFFCVPSYISGVYQFGWDFCVCNSFLNPTIEVATFHLREWCMLGMFFLQAFARLGHEYQDLLSPCYGMHVCTD